MDVITKNSTTDEKKLLSVTNDVVFKAIFGQEDSKPILCSLLNAILCLNIKDPEQIELLNTEINPEHLDNKKCVLDIKIRLADKTSIDVEIQVVNQYNMDRRSIYYVSKLCAEQLNSGNEYSLLRPSIGLNLLCYNMFEDDRYHRCFVLKDRDTNEFLSDLIRIEFLEIHKALRIISTKDKKQERNSDNLTEMEQWTLFIGSDNREVQKMLATQNKAIEAAYSKLQHVSSDEKLRAQAISREKAIRDWNSSINGSYRAGLEKGESNARNEAALNMITFMRSRNNSDHEIIEFLIHSFRFSREEAIHYIKNNS